MERSELLEVFGRLRVADVRDGMDALGWHGAGSMEPQVRPLWRTRSCGIARTARYLPFRGRVPELTSEAYAAWSGRYYRDICPYPWIAALEPGDLAVIDVSGVNAGLMGSENTLAAVKRGVRGFVMNGGGIRDTDEVILQQVPVWSVFVSQSMVQGRLQFDAADVPVAVGGVTVKPGDVVVADGDGVIVVPSEIAADVARLGHEEHERDKAQRARHYQALGRALDSTVQAS